MLTRTGNLPDWFAGVEVAEEEAAVKEEKPIAANDRMRVAIVGTSTRGNYLLNRARCSA